jgi:ABC-2 type transport system ATP-binding protein
MRRKLYEHVRESATNRGAAVILTSHILSDVERVADGVLIIDRGKELLSGEMETLREEIGELEVPAGQDLPENMPFEILASKSEEGQRRCWIRCKEGREKAQTAVEGLRLRFNISLEDLYLALVDKEPTSLDRVKGIQR